MNASSPDSLFIAELVQKHLQGNLTDEEKAILDAWITSGEEHQRLWGELNDGAIQQQYARSMAQYHETEALERFLKKHSAANPPVISPGIHVLNKWRWVAAAVVIAVMAVAGYLWFSYTPSKPPELVVNPPHIDIAPGKNGAILILANGNRVVLDSMQNGVVATESGTEAILKNGELVYAPGKGQSGEMVYNTISVPNGRVFHLTLPDGTQVWLNSASSIRYPVAFTGSQRQVEISGEAYFEVVKNTKMPFRVAVDDRAEIEVLGTHFNVNAYDNEETLSTTLLEGSVRVAARRTGSQGDQYAQVLLPGQQLQLSEKGTNINEPDIDKVIAWKNGLFNFDGVELKNAMKQIARWYDVEIVYRGKAPDIKFYGRISKDISLAGLIKGFQTTGVQMMIENGRQLVVMP